MAWALVACRGRESVAPETLPRGIAPGSTAPVTDREASRSVADRSVDVGALEANPASRGGIEVPSDSSAAGRNWRPRSDDDADDGGGDEGGEDDEVIGDIGDIDDIDDIDDDEDIIDDD